jgi:hypothetical protein
MTPRRGLHNRAIAARLWPAEAGSWLVGRHQTYHRRDQWPFQIAGRPELSKPPGRTARQAEPSVFAQFSALRSRGQGGPAPGRQTRP